MPPEGSASAGGSAMVILCAVPQDFDAPGLAAELVGSSLAACVQIGCPLTSFYRWKGVLESSAERLVLIKTRSELFAQVEGVIRARHPYEVPEIIGLPVTAGYQPYLAWLDQATRTPDFEG